MTFDRNGLLVCRDGREVKDYKVRGAYVTGKVGGVLVAWSSLTGHEAFNGNSMLERPRDLVNRSR